MKRFTAILLSIFTVFALTACQSTPEAAVVVRKDFDILIERAAGSNDPCVSVRTLLFKLGSK